MFMRALYGSEQVVFKNVPANKHLFIHVMEDPFASKISYAPWFELNCEDLKWIADEA